MNKLSDLEYLKLSKLQRLWYKIQMFFLSIPGKLVKAGNGILDFFRNIVLKIRDFFLDIATTFSKGNWAVKLSFFIFGAGNLYYGQIARGLMFLLFELVFIVYMVLPSGGIYWLQKGQWFQKGATVGTVQGGNIYDPIFDTEVWQTGDDSVKVMLYGLLTILFIFAFLYTWRLQVKQCRICSPS